METTITAIGQVELLVFPPAEIAGGEDKMEQLGKKAQVFSLFLDKCICLDLAKPFPVQTLSSPDCRSQFQNE